MGVFEAIPVIYIDFRENCQKSLDNYYTGS